MADVDRHSGRAHDECHSHYQPGQNLATPISDDSLREQHDSAFHSLDFPDSAETPVCPIHRLAWNILEEESGLTRTRVTGFQENNAEWMIAAAKRDNDDCGFI
jgi:hypothetical protein